ncbi:DUF2752 domain-containing protein [Marinirhabdus gelatinilytica]|uniref:DUF2752 domain-containing protein n=1 Tax=Marinirhabdus gelatinilytica TaxID=1703343 RepID=UPI003743C8E3
MRPISKRITIVIASSFVFFLLLLVYFSFNPTQYSFFLSCPFKSLTGYHCAGCGSQRAIHHLLHLNLYTAFRLNPFMVLSLPLVMYGLGTKIYNYIFQQSHRVQLFYKPWFIYGYFAVALIYWVLRNIPVAPFHYLAPYGE